MIDNFVSFNYILTFIGITSNSSSVQSDMNTESKFKITQCNERMFNNIVSTVSLPWPELYKKVTNLVYVRISIQNINDNGSYFLRKSDHLLLKIET